MNTGIRVSNRIIPSLDMRSRCIMSRCMRMTKITATATGMITAITTNTGMSTLNTRTAMDMRQPTKRKSGIARSRTTTTAMNTITPASITAAIRASGITNTIRTMMMSARFKLRACLVCAFAATASIAHAGDMPVPLQHAAKCMLRVLRTTAGVSHATMGVATTGGWTHPYLEYRASEKTHWIEPTRFDADKPMNVDSGPYEFTAMLPGVVPTGEQLDFHVTDRITDAWQKKCGVHGVILTE